MQNKKVTPTKKPQQESPDLAGKGLNQSSIRTRRQGQPPEGQNVEERKKEELKETKKNSGNKIKAEEQEVKKKEKKESKADKTKGKLKGNTKPDPEKASVLKDEQKGQEGPGYQNVPKPQQGSTGMDENRPQDEQRNDQPQPNGGYPQDSEPYQNSTGSTGHQNKEENKAQDSVPGNRGRKKKTSKSEEEEMEIESEKPDTKADKDGEEEDEIKHFTKRKDSASEEPKKRKKIKTDSEGNSLRSTKHLLFPKSGNKDRDFLQGICYRIRQIKSMMTGLCWLIFSRKKGVILLKYDSSIEIPGKILDMLACDRKPVPPHEKSYQLHDYFSRKYLYEYDFQVDYESTEQQAKKTRSEIQSEVKNRKAQNKNSSYVQNAEQEKYIPGNTDTIHSNNESRFNPSSPAFWGSENSFYPQYGFAPIYPNPALTINNPLQTHTTCSFPSQPHSSDLLDEMIRLITTEYYTVSNLFMKYSLNNNTKAIQALVENDALLKKNEETVTTSMNKPGYWQNLLQEKRGQILKELERQSRLKFPSSNPQLIFVKKEAIDISDDDNDTGEVLEDLK